MTGVPLNTNLDKSAELYNPATGIWSLTGTTATYHEYGSATLLANGQVLVAGGDDPFDFSPPALTAAAELYNPATGQWTVTGSMPSARRYQAAVLLANGEVLVAGGEDSSFGSIATAILYNPATGTWQPTASMHQSRALPLAELLANPLAPLARTAIKGAPDQYHEVCLGANARINALTAWRVFQRAMSRPRLHATSTAKSISGAMDTPLCDIPSLPPCQRRRPVSPGWVPRAQLAVLINHPAR